MNRVTLFDITAGSTIEDIVIEMMKTAEKTGWDSQAEINGRIVTVSPSDNLNEVMRRHGLLASTCILKVDCHDGLVQLRRNGSPASRSRNASSS